MSDRESVVEDPYPDLRELLPIDMVTFAYQIADGMVSNLLVAKTMNDYNVWGLHTGS